MVNGIKSDQRVDRAWSGTITPGLHFTSNYTSQMNYTHSSDDSFAKSVSKMIFSSLFYFKKIELFLFFLS